MSCSCNCNCCERIKAETITLDGDILTIEVPEDVVFKDGKCYCVCLFKNIPADANCVTIVIKNVNGGGFVFNCQANYWRPCNLKCRSILQVRYLNDPEHFIIEHVYR